MSAACCLPSGIDVIHRPWYVQLGYADALIRTGTRLDEAKQILHAFMTTSETDGKALCLLIRSKLMYARLLHVQGEDAEAKTL